MSKKEIASIDFELNNNHGMSQREREYLLGIQNSLIDNLIVDAMLEEF